MQLYALLNCSDGPEECFADYSLHEVQYDPKTSLARFLFLGETPSADEVEAISLALAKRYRTKVEVSWITEEQSSPSILPLYDEPVCVPRGSNMREKKETPALQFGRFAKKEDLIPLANVTQSAKKIMTQGTVQNVEEIPTKSGSIIFRYDLFSRDGGALSGKYFSKEKEADSVRAVLSKGNFVCVRGQLQFDSYANQLLFMTNGGRPAPEEPMTDPAAEKRVECAVHTQMSMMEGTIDAENLVKRLKAWGHTAVGITDVGSLQAYPLIAKAVKGTDIKVLYGVQTKLLDDDLEILSNPYHVSLPDEPKAFTVFDLETTGFSRYSEAIIEIGAVRYEDGQKVDEFSAFVNPQRSIPERITELTSITDAMVAGAPTIEEVLPRFLEFAKDSIWVAHNARFDVGFIRENAKRLGLSVEPVWMDTLWLARCLHPEFKNHKLDTITKELHVPQFHHHRAIDDATATGAAFLRLWEEWKELDIPLSEINRTPSSYPLSRHRESELLVYCPKHSGLKNLYELISFANIDYFDYGRPGLPEKLLREKKEGLLTASGLIGSKLFEAIAEDMPEDYIRAIAKDVDVFVVQPPSFTPTAMRHELVADEAHMQRIIRRLLALGKSEQKPVIAIGTPSYLDPGDRLARNILVNYQRNVDFDENGRFRLLNTVEMKNAFSFLPQETVEEIVVKATGRFADAFEFIAPIPSETYSPELEGAAEELRTSSYANAEKRYGSPLPKLVSARLEKELDSIISNGYSSLYVIARRLVQKSNRDGYLVGSRGSVGSSFVATMADITEVNPLVPHYVCPHCRHSEFIEDGSVESGFDLPPKNCPQCNTPMERDGHTIPFEVFLGFNGDKEPDIDLNFAGVYMPTIHKYTEELFGEGKVFRAGTISGIQEKTAYGFIRKYVEQPYVPEEEKQLSAARIRALQHTMEGTKRTTGQHAGGLMIVPKQMDITDVTPIQYPADDVKSDVRTTHFSYNNLDHCLLKLDELGHTSPTIIRQLEEMTGINPLTIRFDDADTMSLFRSTESLKAIHPYSNSSDGTLGIPEFGTTFVRGMLKQTLPTTFGELCRISGLSHGTDVWLNNAEELIRNGKTTLRNAICTRDDIMNYLIHMGMDKLESFKTMESVRKGKGIPEGVEEHMKEHNVPDWYIDSCQRIKYMFPKSHATAYVMMSYRIAWFKVHQPAAFYATYFTQHLSLFSSSFLVSSLEEAQTRMKELQSAKEAGEAIDGGKWALWEIIEEMFARGLTFAAPSRETSDATVFRTAGSDAVLPPLAALDDVSESNAESIKSAMQDGEFLSRSDFKQRTRIPRSAFQSLVDHGLLNDLPESNQMSFLPGF